MSLVLPLAIVLGRDNFVARMLVERLEEKGLKVIFSDGDDLGEEKPSYVFDFEGREDLWRNWKETKLTIVGVNRKIANKEVERVMVGSGVNYRIVELRNVFGEGMEDDWFWGKRLREAVENKNLRLPERKTEIRLLEVGDGVEAILRASFFYGTEGQKFEIWGNKYSAEELAIILIKKAKMTRVKVMETEEEVETAVEGKVVEEWGKLRWKPEVDFKKATEKVLRYFFSKIDEEKRRGIKPGGGVKKVREEVKREEVVAKLRVETWEEEVEKEEKRREMAVVEVEEEPEPEPIVDEDIDWQIKPMLKKKEENKKEEEDLVEIEEEEEVELKKEPEKIVEEKKAEKTLVKKRNGFGWKKLFLGVILGLVTAGILGWVMEGVVVARNIAKAAELIKKEESLKALEIIEREKERVGEIEARITNWGLNGVAVGRNYQTLLRVAGEVLELEEAGAEGVVMAGRFYRGLWGEEEVNWEELLGESRELLARVEATAGLLEARLGGDWSWLPGKLRSDVAKMKTEVEENRKYVMWAGKFIEIWPEIAATEGGRRDYLVLLQNENEIRATGGFIGSFGILTLEEGKLVDFEIRDIYEIDGQLKGHVEPPEEIKKYLGEAKWYMRDANWEADFVKTSKNIQWFFEKEAGRKVDGVMGMNLAVAKELLGVVGEVSVPDFGEKINKDNLYEQAEFHSDSKFFPGSNEKASFLGAVGKQLFEEIKLLEPEKRVQFVKTMFDLMEKNELQLSFNKTESATVMREMRWDGAIWEGSVCSGERCESDYLFLVESNLGVNKANYFVTRNVEHKVDIGERAIARMVKINYENTAKNREFPGGDYKNYLRIYVPSGVNLAEVSVSGEDGKKKIYTGEELKIREVNNKKEIGFLVMVPIMSRRVVELKYSSSIDISQGEKFSYLSYIQKQSGVGEVGWVSLVSLPKNWQILQVDPVATVVGGSLLFNQKMDRDITIGVEIGR